MNLSTLAQIVFFGVWAYDFFWPFKSSQVIIAVAAGVIALCLLFPWVKKLFSNN